MVIYEVNITVDNSIFQKYLAWLKQHLIEMLEIDGFCDVRTYIVESNNDIKNNTRTKQIVVNYKVESLQKLQNYLDHVAARMRSSTKDLFGDHISITRRVLVNTDL